jgi:hypothetical protein
MTPEQQRIAIAEACGLTPHPDNDNRPDDLKFWSPQYSGKPGLVYTLDGPEYGEFPRSQHDARLPDYLNDLNAMHEAEKMIKGTPYWKTYETLLAQIVSGDNGMFHITASQRAEAFLKTLNLWTP